jgi:hypothetical protein
MSAVTLTRMPSASPTTAPITGKSHVPLVIRGAHFTAGARGGSRRTAPCGEAVRLRFLPSAVGFVVGPELERALAVLYRAKRHMRVTFARSVCPRLAAPRTGFSRSGRMCEALAPAPATRRARSVSTCSWAVLRL